MKGNFSDTQVKEAILQTFGNLDKPLSPANLAANDFLKIKLGDSPEIYENYTPTVALLTTFSFSFYYHLVILQKYKLTDDNFHYLFSTKGAKIHTSSITIIRAENSS